MARAFLLSSGAPGTVAQGRGLLQALGLLDKARFRVIEKPRLASAPLSLLSHALGDPLGLTPCRGVIEEIRLETTSSSSSQSAAQRDPAPLDRDPAVLVVACGHSAMSTAAEAKRICGVAVFVVAIQHPQMPLHLFDLVITPAHDWIQTPLVPGNVFLTQGALHPVSKESLTEARELEATSALRGLLHPLVVMAIGGPTRNCPWTCKAMSAFAEAVAAEVQSFQGTLLIAPSRRTPPQLLEVLLQELHRGARRAAAPSTADEGGGRPGCLVELWRDMSLLPVYAAVQEAAAEGGRGGAIIVTADSITMVSEAASTGAPLLVAGSEMCRGKLVAFHLYLTCHGHSRPLRLTAPPLDLADEIGGCFSTSSGSRDGGAATPPGRRPLAIPSPTMNDAEVAVQSQGLHCPAAHSGGSYEAQPPPNIVYSQQGWNTLNDTRRAAEEVIKRRWHKQHQQAY